MSTHQNAAAGYDAMPYRGNFIPMSHPDRMAAMAVLHGLEPPAVECCRVLELGCTDGGNLFAMAQALPAASFLGIDLSPVQIAQGKAVAHALGAANVDLRTWNIADVDDRFGLFDYMICHGVYSWVPAPVRDKILDICDRNLAPAGIAFVSYNTYPGWHQRRLLRELMLYHTAGIGDPAKKVEQARAILEFVAQTATPGDSPFAQDLRAEHKHLEKRPDTYLFHDHLADENHPVYFHEFVAHARSHGLRYLSNATFGQEETRLSPEAQHVLGRLGADHLRREQYVDFLLNRTFRMSLLCHAGLAPSSRPSPDALRGLRIVAMARPENPEPDLLSNAHEPFLSSYGDRVLIDEPLLKAAIVALYRLWPQSAGFDELWTATLELLGRRDTPSPEETTQFATELLLCHMARVVNFHSFDPPIAVEPGDRPHATALARRTAAAGERVVSLRNHVAVLEDVDRLILSLLDGSRDQAAIVASLAADVAAGRLKLKGDGKPIVEPEEVRQALEPTVKSSLQRIAYQALLVKSLGP